MGPFNFSVHMFVCVCERVCTCVRVYVCVCFRVGPQPAPRNRYAIEYIPHPLHISSFTYVLCTLSTSYKWILHEHFSSERKWNQNDSPLF